MQAVSGNIRQIQAVAECCRHMIAYDGLWWHMHAIACIIMIYHDSSCIVLYRSPVSKIFKAFQHILGYSWNFLDTYAILCHLMPCYNVDASLHDSARFSSFFFFSLHVSSGFVCFCPILSLMCDACDILWYMWYSVNLLWFAVIIFLLMRSDEYWIVLMSCSNLLYVSVCDTMWQ